MILRTLFIILTLSIFSITTSRAQLGLNLSYLNENSENELFKNLPDNLAIGLSYHQAIVKQFLTTTPTISYTRNINSGENSVPQYISLAIPINFYPFLISSDCDCPEIEKKRKNPINNLHLSVIPSYYINPVAYNTMEASSIKKYFLGVGLGMDIPLGNHFITTPQVSYHFWNHSSELSNEFDFQNLASTLFSFGMNLRFP